MKPTNRFEKQQMVDWMMFNTICKRDFIVWMAVNKDKEK
jgi:hypothetical protein